MAEVDEKTKKILDAFAKISVIPRCSKNEEKICAFLMEWAASKKFPAKKDRMGNVVITVPATSGYEKSPKVILQGHVDMVCEKTPDSLHDFSKDPIKMVFDGDWLRADNTTLGADNGIAVAMAMVVAESTDVLHPALELLFTVNEEQGLFGANALEPGFIEGKILLNIDSEDEGVFTVGCAGGRDTHISLMVQFHEVDANYKALRIKAGGMAGGHSGVNIHEERANAIQILARFLHQLKHQHSLFIGSIQGGTAHNAIPRDAEALIFVPVTAEAEVTAAVKRNEATFKSEFKVTDPGFTLTCTPEPGASNRVLNVTSSAKVVDLLIALPHGVTAMSTEMKGLVETSNNLASIRMEGSALKIVTSQRSSVMSRLHAITHKVETVARLAGAEAQSSKGYPSWQPNLDSPLLARFRKIYKELFGKEAHVESIHAGLECGIIGDKYPGMDMISFGPTLKNPHSPVEKIHIGSIGQVWDLLVEVLKSYR